MKTAQHIPLSVQATVSRPASELRGLLRNVLAHLSRTAHITLSVDLPRELHTPVEAALRVPAHVQVQEDPGGGFAIRVAAAGRQFRSFPAFWGTVTVAPSNGNSAVVTLRGTYTLPQSAAGGDVDKTFLRRAAHSSMRQFLEEVIQETARRAPAPVSR